MRLRNNDCSQGPPHQVIWFIKIEADGKTASCINKRKNGEAHCEMPLEDENMKVT